MMQPTFLFVQQFHQFDAQRNIIILKCLLLRHVRSGMNIFLRGNRDVQL